MTFSEPQMNFIAIQKKKNANQEQICDAIYDYISDVPVSCYSSISISAI